MPRATDTRDRILATAADLFWVRGYAAVGMDEVCRVADVRKGCLYHHFESKADLTLAVFDELWAGATAQMDALFSPQKPALARIGGYLAHVRESQARARERFGVVCGCPFTNVGTEQGPQDERIRTRITEIMGAKSRYLASALRDGMADGSIPHGDALLMAGQLQAYLLGCVSLARVEDSLEPLSLLESGAARLLGVPHL